MKIYLTREEQAEIAGTLADLQQIHSSIQSLIHSPDSEIAIDADSTDQPAPWDECLARLVLRKGTGKINVFATQDELVIAGGPEHFEAVASYFDFDEKAEFPEHHHLEYYPGDVVLQEKALSLVIGFENPRK